VILIGYDGSPDAQAAIELAGELFPGQPATVLSVWEPFVDVMARTGLGLAFTAGANIDEIDRASEQAARERADEGVERAGTAGLKAQPRIGAREATIAEAILEVAEELKARVIVLGTRGLTGLKSVVLGSVSHAVLVHTDRAVLVVPPPAVASARAEHLHPQ
jgi:nucleotide-binding universal stress UspA family protein